MGDTKAAMRDLAARGGYRAALCALAQPGGALAWRLAALGVVVGVFDVACLGLIGVELTHAGTPTRWQAWALFGSTYASLGWLLGRLLEAQVELLRQQAGLRAHAATIEAQLDQLEGAQRRVVQAETLAELGRMAASVAHEVRNPLAVIRGAVGLMAEALPASAASAARAGAFAREEVDRLEAFVQAVLGYARPLPPAPQRVATAALIDHAVQAAAPHLAGRQVAVQVAPGAVALQLDPDQIGQALVNLLINAGQATAVGGRIALTVEVAAAGDGVAFVVDDDGPGLPPGEPAALFLPFASHRAEGTGLGLARVAQVAGAHGGSAEAGAGPLGGARFCLRLPATALGDSALAVAA